MVEEMKVTLRKQVAGEDKWLYQDTNDGGRVFVKYAYLGINASLWEECSDAEKESWELAHQAVEEAEVVE